MKPAFIIHGGCDTVDLSDSIESMRKNAQREGLARVAEEGKRLLQDSKPALDVVERLINMLEEDPTFNAGRGGALGVSKRVELDASIMDGKSMNCGAVAGLHGVVRAVSVARAVMEKTKHCFLAGEGVNKFARENGFEFLPNEYFITPYQEHWYNLLSTQNAEHRVGKGTVGAVVMDSKGNLAAGTSTGGLTLKMQGRVGDSPMVGCGSYAENGIGAASATGWGEQIIKSVLCHSAVECIRYTKCEAQKAAEVAIARLAKLERGFGGIIMIDASGKVGAFANEKFLPRAYCFGEMKEPRVKLAVDEE